MRWWEPRVKAFVDWLVKSVESEAELDKAKASIPDTKELRLLRRTNHALHPAAVPEEWKAKMFPPWKPHNHGE